MPHARTEAEKRYKAEAIKFCSGKYKKGSDRYETCVWGVFDRIKRNAAKSK